MKFSRATLPACLAFALLTSGCSVLDENKVDYRSAKKGETLEIPPDLTALARNDRYAVNTDGSVNALGYQNTNQVSQNLPTAANSVADVRIEREGNKRWLVVNRPAAVVWPLVAGFWKDNGFTLANQQEALGIMETDWAENRAKLPKDFIRETIGKAFDGLYETGERDKFRTRLENQGDKTEIYITHRGMVEQLTSKGGRENDSTTWVPRASDPELEAEFLRRLMLKLGVNETQAKAESEKANNPAAPAATLAGDTLNIHQGFDAAWRQIGLALDRSNFTVSDRDRSKGVYFVRYIPDGEKDEEPGFFGKLFGSEKKSAAAQQEYRVTLSRTDEAQSQASVETATGQKDATTRKILQILADSLK
jgi:outer membrane protein assembly factor BamC